MEWSTMEMVDGKGGMDTAEVEDGEEVVVIVAAVEEAMVVGMCNKRRVVTMTMVDQGHHLCKTVVSS